MKYHLVALFDTESYSDMEAIQKNICKKYKLYKNTPFMHIALETIEDPDIEKLSKILTDILKPYKKFKVETSGLLSFDPPYKSVKLKIENKGYIIRLARTINDTLKLHGFNVRENVENWDLNVPLASSTYTIKELPGKEFAAATSASKKEGFYKLPKIERIELWKTVNNKKEPAIKSFPLRST